MNAMDQEVATQFAPLAARAERRAGWQRQITLWHWMSSAIALVGMLFFAVSGITLVHADLFESATAHTVRREAQLPAPVMSAINAVQDDKAPLPPALRDWLDRNWQLVVYPKGIEWSADELFIDLKRPGVDVSLSVDRHSGRIEYESIDRGWVAWLNELHRGRNAGPVWAGFLTVFGVACAIFSLTGLLLLQTRARGQWKVWPLTGLGLVLPLVLILLFIH